VVGTASAICGEVLEVGSAVRDYQSGDLIVLACPSNRANTAFLGPNNGWYRTQHGMVGCPLSSVLCVPEDMRSLEAAFALQKVPKGLHTEEALMASDPMIAGLAAAIHAISDPSPPPPPLWSARSSGRTGANGTALDAPACDLDPPQQQLPSRAALGMDPGAGALYAVFGCGAVGLMSVCALRQLAGPDATIIAVDEQLARRKLAQRLGATDSVSPDDARSAVQARANPSHAGCAGVVEASGNAMLELALACLADEGALACVASQYGTRPAATAAVAGGPSPSAAPLSELPVPLDVLAERALRVSFTQGDVRQLLPHALQLVSSLVRTTAGSEALRTVISHRISLDDVEQAYDAARDVQRNLKVVIYPGKTEVRQVGTAVALFSMLD